ncbi:VOC family protein [Flavihumibacter sp. R14]|nr:VOC family protein [Flavihumibacter soli]
MENKDQTLLQGIDTVILRVCNIDVSKAWYQVKLGLKPIWEDSRMSLVVLDTNSPTSLTLWQTDQLVSVNRRTASFPIFKTTDATLLREVLESRDVEVGEVIQDALVSYFPFYDPDGNVLEACQVNE